jgi:hypothetical protein
MIFFRIEWQGIDKSGNEYAVYKQFRLLRRRATSYRADGRRGRASGGPIRTGRRAASPVLPVASRLGKNGRGDVIRTYVPCTPCTLPQFAVVFHRLPQCSVFSFKSIA